MRRARLGFPIVKKQAQADGSLVIWGKATDESLDRDGQIVDADFASRALTEWFDDLGASIRNMHSGTYPPAGKGIALDIEPDGAYVRARIVEPTAIRLVNEDVYKDLSVGIFDPEVTPDVEAPGGRITDGWIGEVSLVDLGSNKNAHFSIAKRASRDEAGVLLGVLGAVERASRKVKVAGRAKAPSAGGRRAKSCGSCGGPMKNGKCMKCGFKVKVRDLAGRLVSAKSVAIKAQDKPGVQSGDGRGNLDDSDFVIIEKDPDSGDKVRKFPIENPGDVSDAVSSWGRYKPESGSGVSFEQFKKRLTSIANRKGPAFVKELPASWSSKKGQKAMKKLLADPAKAAKKEADAAGGNGDGGKQCPTCDGSGKIMEGNRQCPDCKGKGKVPANFEKARKDATPEELKAQADAELKAQAAAAVSSAQRAGDIAGAAVSAAVTSAIAKGHDADEDVNDAIDSVAADSSQLDDDVDDLQDAQAEDDATEPDDNGKAAKPKKAKGKKGAVEKPLDPVAGDTEGQDTKLDDADQAGSTEGSSTAVSTEAVPKRQKKGGKKSSARKGGKKGKVPPQFAAEEKKPKAKKRGKGKPAAATPDAEGTEKPLNKKPKAAQRIHDVLCPVFSGEDLKAAYPGYDQLPVTDVINPMYFAEQLESLTAGAAKADDRSVGAAYQAFAAAHGLTALRMPSVEELRELAHKTFADSYPDVSVKPGMINPGDYKRPFLSGATPETSTRTQVDNPDLKPSVDASQFTRAALTDNETRPTLSGGDSVTGYSGKGKKGKKAKARKDASPAAPTVPLPSRLFYRNTDKDQWSSAMSLLHDHIVDAYPGICPMHAVMPGSAIDSDGQAGLPAEMQIMHPGQSTIPTPVGAGSGRLTPAKTAAATPTKGAEEAPVSKAALKAQVDKAVAKVEKRAQKRERKLQAKLAKAVQQLRAPDPSKAPVQRMQAFRPKADLTTQAKRAEAFETARRLKSRMVHGDTATAAAAQDQMRRTFSPKQYARIVTADEEMA